MRTLIKNIKELVGVEQTPQLRKQGQEMAQLETIKDSYLVIEDGKIVAFGRMEEENHSQTSILKTQFDRQDEGERYAQNCRGEHHAQINFVHPVLQRCRFHFPPLQ